MSRLQTKLKETYCLLGIPWLMKDLHLCTWGSSCPYLTPFYFTGPFKTNLQILKLLCWVEISCLPNIFTKTYKMFTTISNTVNFTTAISCVISVYAMLVPVVETCTKIVQFLSSQNHTYSSIREFLFYRGNQTYQSVPVQEFYKLR